MKQCGCIFLYIVNGSEYNTQVIGFMIALKRSDMLKDKRFLGCARVAINTEMENKTWVPLMDESGARKLGLLQMSFNRFYAVWFVLLC